MAIGKDATEEELAEYLIALMKAKGVACSTVKNGHMLMFKRSWLEDLLKATPDAPEVCIFIERPDFENKGN